MKSASGVNWDGAQGSGGRRMDGGGAGGDLAQILEGRKERVMAFQLSVTHACDGDTGTMDGCPPAAPLLGRAPLGTGLHQADGPGQEEQTGGFSE